MKETKSERFQRLSNARFLKFKEIMRVFRNMSNTQVYQYTDEEVDTLIKNMHDEVDILERVLKHKERFHL